MVGLTNRQGGWADAGLHRRHQMGKTKETNISPENTIDRVEVSRLEDAISTRFAETRMYNVRSTQRLSIASE